MALSTIDGWMARGIEHHQAGQLAEARGFYELVLAQQTDHPDALHLSGVLWGQEGRVAEGILFIRRALGLRPRNAIYWSNLGKFLLDEGQFDQAMDACLAALHLDPNLTETHNNLGTALQRMGRYNEAIGCYEQALRRRPEYVEALSNLGSALRDAGRLEEAEATCRRALQINPNHAEAHANLGSVLKELKRLDEAVAYCLRSVQLQPQLAVGFNNLASALLDKGMREEAVTAYRQAVLLSPRLAEAHNNLGIALRDLGQAEAAIAAYRRAVELKPDFVEATRNLGMAIKDEGRFEEGMALYREALELNPEYPETHWNIALLALLMGDFTTGWREYEWRWRCKHTDEYRRDFKRPLWDGSPGNGRTMLVHTEQGFGDTIQFIRYVPQVVERGWRVVLDCPAVLTRLMGVAPGVSAVVATDPKPPFDVHCPTMSMPGILWRGLENIPAPRQYLWADRAETEKWEGRLSELEAGRRLLRVGLVWAGYGKHTNDRNRSLRLADLAGLAEVGGVRWISLQKGDAAEQVSRAGGPFGLIDWTSELPDFAATAGLVANLDLVITVDTAVAHLAGALGKAVWVMLPWVPDWRWLLGRADCPWYPTMRLFRQGAKGEWGTVLRNVGDALMREVELEH